MKASGREVELSRNRLTNLEAFMSHANAALTPRARLTIARLIVDEHWPVARAAERYDVSWPEQYLDFSSKRLCRARAYES